MTISESHTIIIDDIRCCDTVDFDFTTLDKIKKLIKEINKNYKFRFEDGFIPDDVLVAYIDDE